MFANCFSFWGLCPPEPLSGFAPRPYWGTSLSDPWVIAPPIENCWRSHWYAVLLAADPLAGFGKANSDQRNREKAHRQ